MEYLTVQNFGRVAAATITKVSSTTMPVTTGHIQYNTGQEQRRRRCVHRLRATYSRYNCLTSNEQYGFSAYEPAGPSNVTEMDHNEISYNNTHD